MCFKSLKMSFKTNLFPHIEGIHSTDTTCLFPQIEDVCFKYIDIIPYSCTLKKYSTKTNLFPIDTQETENTYFNLKDYIHYYNRLNMYVSTETNLFLLTAH